MLICLEDTRTRIPACGFWKYSFKFSRYYSILPSTGYNIWCALYYMDMRCTCIMPHISFYWKEEKRKEKETLDRKEPLSFR